MATRSVADDQRRVVESRSVSLPLTDPAGLSPRVRLWRALVLLLMTAVLPGAGQLVGGNRRLGRAALAAWLVITGTLTLACVVVALDRGLAVSLLSRPPVLVALSLGCFAGALAWPVWWWTPGGWPGDLLRGSCAVGRRGRGAGPSARCRWWQWAGGCGRPPNWWTASSAPVPGPRRTVGTVLLLGSDWAQPDGCVRQHHPGRHRGGQRQGDPVLLPRNLRTCRRGTLAQPGHAWLVLWDDCLLNRLYTWGHQHGALPGPGPRGRARSNSSPASWGSRSTTTSDRPARVPGWSTRWAGSTSWSVPAPSGRDSTRSPAHPAGPPAPRRVPRAVVRGPTLHRLRPMARRRCVMTLPTNWSRGPCSPGSSGSGRART